MFLYISPNAEVHLMSSALIGSMRWDYPREGKGVILEQAAYTRDEPRDGWAQFTHLAKSQGGHPLAGNQQAGRVDKLGAKDQDAHL